MSRRYIGNLDREEHRVTIDRLYLVTRRDLPPGAQIAQTVHAAIEIALEVESLPDTVVIVTVEDESSLLLLYEQLNRENRQPFEWLEVDRGYEMTAIAVVSAGHPKLADLPLLFPEENTSKSEPEEEKSA